MALCRRQNKALLFAAVAFSVWCGVPSRTCSAQTKIEKYGVEFDVDRVAPTGVGQSLLQIGGQEQIVSDIRLSSVVVREYLNNEELFKKLSLVKILALIQGAIENKDEVLYEETVLAVSRYVSDMQEGTAEFYDALARQPRIVEKISQIIDTHQTSEFSPSALPQYLAIIILNKTDNNFGQVAGELIQNKSPQIKSVLKTRFFNALKDANPTVARTIAERIGAVFGSEDPDTKSLTAVLERLEGSASLSEFSSVLMELSTQDPQLRRSLATIALDLLHERVKKLIEQDQIVLAFHELSQVDVDRRTPRTHQLAAVAAKNVRYADFEALQTDEKAREFIKFIGVKDQNFRDVYIESIEREIFNIFSEKEFSQQLLTSGFALLDDVRPEPNVLNDRIRIKCIELAYKTHQTAAVSFIKSDIRSSLSFIDEGHLLLLFLKYNMLIIGAIILGGIGVCVWLLRKLRRNGRQRREREERQQTATNSHDSIQKSSDLQQEEADSERPLFVKNRAHSAKYPAQYIELLSEFGLTPESSLKEIKSTYRTRMKDIHPDVAGAKSTHSDFIHYQEVYERILDFRKRLGLEI